MRCNNNFHNCPSMCSETAQWTKFYIMESEVMCDIKPIMNTVNYMEVEHNLLQVYSGSWHNE